MEAFHPLDYGLERKLGALSDLVLPKEVPWDRMEKYVKSVIHSHMRNLDALFTSNNPSYRVGEILGREINDNDTIESIILEEERETTTMPFRPIFGISGGVDSAAVAVMVCETYQEMRLKQDRANLERDRITILNLKGDIFNPFDADKGEEFVRGFLLKKYEDVPIDFKVIEEVNGEDYRKLIESCRGNDVQINCNLTPDYFKSAATSNIAEMLGHRSIDTTNLTEEFMGEVTDGTGGLAQFWPLPLPKSMLYVLHRYFGTPKEHHGIALDTCQGGEKLKNYFRGSDRDFEGVEPVSVFCAIDKVLTAANDNSNGTYPTVNEVIQRTGQHPEIVRNIIRRSAANIRRINLGGRVSNSHKLSEVYGVEMPQNHLINPEGLREAYGL